MSALIMKDCGAACWKAVRLEAEVASRLRMSSVRLDCAPWALSDPTCSKQLRLYVLPPGGYRPEGVSSHLLVVVQGDHSDVWILGQRGSTARLDQPLKGGADMRRKTCFSLISGCRCEAELSRQRAVGMQTDLQGAVAAVEVIQTRRIDELLVNSS